VIRDTCEGFMENKPIKPTPFDLKLSQYYDADNNRILEENYGLTDGQVAGERFIANGQPYRIQDIRVEDGIQKIVVECLDLFSWKSKSLNHV
jgi:hypothetical protein